MFKGKIFGKEGIFAKIGKRNLMIVCAVLLIGVAVYLNYVWFYNPTGNLGYGENNMENQYGDSTGTGSANTAETYFTSAQVSREKARDEALEVLQTVVNSADALQETKDAVLTQLQACQAGKYPQMGFYGKHKIALFFRKGELVEHGVTGLLVPPSDANALTDALIAVANACGLLSFISFHDWMPLTLVKP